MPSFPYAIINAFTRSPLGGNPAAVVLLPSGSLSDTCVSTPIMSPAKMGAVGKSLAQPITVFVAPSSSDDDGSFDVRYFIEDVEVPLCGHGALATMKAFCRGLLQPTNGKDNFDAPLRFKTGAGLTICASVSWSSDDPDGELYAIELPATPVEPLTGSEKDQVHEAVARALRKPTADIDIRHIAHGTRPYETFLMVVLSGDEVLDGREVDTNAFLDLGPFSIVSLSQLTRGKLHAFESRVFAPANGLPEDQVCGTAHTLMVPYYASQSESGVRMRQEAYVRQVSPRGGDLWVTFDEKREVIVFRGNAKLFAKGELVI